MRPGSPVRSGAVALAAALALSALAGCRTAPPAPPTALSAYLPPDAAAYVYLDVAAAPAPARRIISAAGVEDRDAGRILARTERVAAALTGPLPAGDGEAGAAPGGRAGFVLAASGRIPGFLVEATLADEDGWSRETVTVGGTRYGVWRRDADGVELAFPERRLVLAGTGGVVAALGRQAAAPTPGAVSARRFAAVLAVPRTEMPGPFGSRGIEVSDLELRGQPSAGGDAAGAPGGPPRAWRIGGAMELPDEGTARAVTALVRLLALSMIAETGADPAEAAGELVVEREGTRVLLDGITMDERYLLDALDEFLLAGVRGPGAAGGGGE
jgi:hypothetical protein